MTIAGHFDQKLDEYLVSNKEGALRAMVSVPIEIRVGTVTAKSRVSDQFKTSTNAIYGLFPAHVGQWMVFDHQTNG